MLVLSRKVGEKIQIGDDVRVSIVGIQGGKVRIAIEAPQDVPVWRNEVVRRDRSCLGRLPAVAVA